MHAFRLFSLAPEAERVLMRTSVPPIRGRYYVRDGEWEAPKDDLSWVELSQLEDVRQLRCSYLQKLVCAALNSKLRLKVCFGISPERKVPVAIEHFKRLLLC